MQLTPEQQAVLDGQKGETLAKVMKTIVMYGDIFGAEKLVPVTHPEGHFVTSFGISLMKPLFATMDELIRANVHTIGKFTVDPRPLDYQNVKCNPVEKLVFAVMYGKQEEYEQQLMQVGLRDRKAFTCTAYLPEVGNVPKKGDVLSWAESSAVVYANSVLGARCNRNSGMIDLFGSIVGWVPYFGLVTDEGRKATWKVYVRTSKKPEAQILGSAIGMKVTEDVPYVFGLDRFLGEELNEETCAYLKDFGAATASNGAVGLYHIVPRDVEKQGRKARALLHRLPASYLRPAHGLDAHPFRRPQRDGQKEGEGAHGDDRRPRSCGKVPRGARIRAAHRDGREAFEHLPAHVHQQPRHQGESHPHQLQQAAHLFGGALLERREDREYPFGKGGRLR